MGLSTLGMSAGRSSQRCPNRPSPRDCPHQPPRSLPPNSFLNSRTRVPTMSISIWDICGGVMIVITASTRTSTVERGAAVAAQLRDLRRVGATAAFREQGSSAAMGEQLEVAIDDLREGNVFAVTTLVRSARSMRDLHKIVERLRQQRRPSGPSR